MAPSHSSSSSASTVLKNNRFCFIALLLLLLWSTQEQATGVVVAAAGEPDDDVSGPVVSVTKHISFFDFNSSKNPRIEHEMKLLGSAKLSSSNGGIQIPAETTGGVRHRAGRAIFSFPVRLFDPHTNATASFNTSFTFQLHNQTNLHGSKEVPGGSGLTFLMAPDEFTVGRPGPWLAMLNDACDNVSSKFVAVEFDTRKNPEFGDPNDNHIGINLGSVVSRVTINASNFGISFHDGSVHRALISYDGPGKRMLIRIGSDSAASEPKTVYSGELDLSPFLREYMFVGFSASTGKLPQIHHILSWNFTSTSKALLRVPRPEACESRLLSKRHSISGEEEEEGKDEPSTLFFIFMAVGVLCFAVLINIYLYSKRKRSILKDEPAALAPEIGKLRPLPPNRPRRFTLEAISSATKGFSESEILTVDEYGGTMYRGVLFNRFQVAVKRFSAQYLSAVNVNSKRQFLKRARSLSRVKQQNLVGIPGWCYDKKKELMLVYEYVFNGCLDKWLFGVGVLPWSRRLEVLRNVAAGLSHLHGCQLAHGNVRVNSVFLDLSFTALLGDFGLGADLGGSNDLAVTRVAGDVFDFGVFVLEVAAGRRRWRGSESDTVVDSHASCSSSSGLDSSAGSSSGREDVDLLDWAWVMHERGEKMGILDGSVLWCIDPEKAVRVVEIGLLCTLSESHGRPKMEEVVRYLNVDGPIPDLPPTRPIVLCPYNSAPNLCGSYVCAPF